MVTDELDPAGVLRTPHLFVGVSQSKKHDKVFLLRVEVIVLLLVRTASAPRASGFEGATREGLIESRVP